MAELAPDLVEDALTDREDALVHLDDVVLVLAVLRDEVVETDRALTAGFLGGSLAFSVTVFLTCDSVGFVNPAFGDAFAAACWDLIAAARSVSKYFVTMLRKLTVSEGCLHGNIGKSDCLCVLISFCFCDEKVDDAFHGLYPVADAVGRRVEHVWVTYIVLGPLE